MDRRSTGPEDLDFVVACLLRRLISSNEELVFLLLFFDNCAPSNMSARVKRKARPACN